MQDRIEVTVVLAVVAAELIATFVTLFTPLNMGLVGQAAFLLMWAFSIFWALNLRRLLSAHLYRNQALGIGLVAIGWAAFDYSFVVPDSILWNVAFTLALLLTFYWIDASILAGRKSDPLYRDTLHWKILRLVLWPVLLGAVTAEYFGILLDPSSFLLITSSGITSNPAPFALVILSVAFFGVFVPGPVSLFVTAFRSRDFTIRRHFQWFGLFAGSFASLIFIGVAIHQPVLISLGYIVATYCIYRSAKSLAPINHIPSSVSASVPVAGIGTG